VFDKFPKYNMKILLRDFNAKVGREDIFKPIIGNESQHEISNDNEVKLVDFDTFKTHRVKSTMLPRHNIHKCTWSPDMKTHNQIDFRSYKGADCDTDHRLVVAKVMERLKVNK
jgi:hypothetical protein